MLADRPGLHPRGGGRDEKHGDAQALEHGDPSSGVRVLNNATNRVQA
jgi:hypothetical protein